MIRVVHPGSGCWLSAIPDPGSRIQGSKRYPIPDPDPLHWLSVPFIWILKSDILMVQFLIKNADVIYIILCRNNFFQCSGSMTFWCGSGSTDPCLWLMDPDESFSTFFFLKVHLHPLQNSRNQGFSYYFCLMIEVSGAGAGSGSIPLTNGSGSGRPKNMWIRWIRIRNTGFFEHKGDRFSTKKLFLN